MPRARDTSMPPAEEEQREDEAYARTERKEVKVFEHEGEEAAYRADFLGRGAQREAALGVEEARGEADGGVGEAEGGAVGLHSVRGGGCCGCWMWWWSRLRAEEGGEGRGALSRMSEHRGFSNRGWSRSRGAVTETPDPSGIWRCAGRISRVRFRISVLLNTEHCMLGPSPFRNGWCTSSLAG
eukprot:CAMPEP_0174886514 /NCGR_PEP_ID=MMETSP0167-20121228/1763_1 /TAXON_ID=38298 /ORGANISM="Rhodella maculata, Strain CCMP736" /LENGTH=182 /DNA_ID=CAMNT_0016122573 /DNA_START=212 /DNA_END=757 /DNA_ORIENTATION=-